MLLMIIYGSIYFMMATARIRLAAPFLFSSTKLNDSLDTKLPLYLQIKNTLGIVYSANLKQKASNLRTQLNISIIKMVLLSVLAVLSWIKPVPCRSTLT